MTEPPKIEQHYLDLLTVEGFIKQFWEFLPDCDTMEEAYEATERKYSSAFGKWRYSDFHSFRACYYRFLDKGKEK